MIITDHLVGRVGELLEAPVGHVALVNVPAELIAGQGSQLAHVAPGVSHGSKWIPGCTDREGVAHTQLPENRVRFARLAVLYGLFGANDHQFIYRLATPHLVHSVDHGHFFPGGPDWTLEKLSNASDPEADNSVVSGCGISSEELVVASESLSSLHEEAIIDIVASPPTEWVLSLDERSGLMKYIVGRRDALSNLYRRDLQ
jgi:hypothetical protein